jgi:tetratricopeptide (TPR) repeat protein/transglutaminase-like putative cysteine protease
MPTRVSRFRPESLTPLRLVAFVLSLAVFAVSGRAGAADQRFHPELARALDELDRTRGPEVYAALRRVWSSWDRADPLHVEEALARAERAPALGAAERAYAGTLWAYARLRRGDLHAARQKIRSLGYVDRWLVLGPFDNEGKAGLEAAHGPEADLASPIGTTKSYQGVQHQVRWRSATDAFPYGFLDLGALLRPEAKVCGFAASFVSDQSPNPGRRPLTAWVGSGGAFRLFWNGRELASHEAYSAHDFDRFAVPLTLEPGPNLLVLKVCSHESSPVVSLRFSDERGAPAERLGFSEDLANAEAAAQLAAKSKGEAAPKSLSPSRGPVAMFDAAVAKKNATARELEAYARYLDATDGDDPALHLARDLARRAAEREPTIERLLLAGRLSEDRNQANDWITRAEQLAGKQQQKPRDLLLARAWHRRYSPNFREALPYFEQALELDPINIEGLRGWLELYNLVGLPRSALARLERALAESPHSVGLLGLYAAQLRTLGRTTEAAEVEARYHGFRFDDGGYLASQLELALDRRERSAAERWAERLVATEPHDLWALGTAARAYRRLGQTDRAITTYRRALALAPDDVGTLRTLADLYGELGRRNEQIAVLREVLRARPQDLEVREYVEHLEPDKPRADEAYAWDATRFLYLRHAPAAGQNRRTLRDLTVSTVFENGLSSRFRQIVFQPLTDSAAAQGRQYVFAYEADSQRAQLRGARVYRKNGKVDEAVESGEGPADDPTISMYTSARAFYVQFPRLEAGDVVELRYRVDDVTPRNEFADYFGEVVPLQGLEPLTNAEYVLDTPKSRTIHVDVRHPGLEHTTRVTANRRIHRFSAKSVPPLVMEPEMPPLSEVMGFVHVSTYANWKDLGRWYAGLVRDQFDLDDETRKLAQSIVRGKTSELDKVSAVYDWVIRNTRYVALEFGIYGYKPRRCVQTVARGWGDCKDKATVIVTLLKELGIDSKLVILRTRMRGDFRSPLASFAPFDHAIAYVPSLKLYLDGTAEHTGVSELPRMDLGALGLLVNDDGGQLVTLPKADPERNFVKRSAVAAVAANGEARLDLEYTTGGFVSAEWRRRYHAAATLRDRVNSDIGSQYPGFEIARGHDGISTSNLDDATAPVRLRIRGVARTFARREGDDLSMDVTASLRLTSKFASLSARSQDVVTEGFSTTEDSVTVELPPGAEVVSAPVPVREEGPFGSFSVELTRSKDRVIVKSRIVVSVSRISPKDYPAWKRFCEASDRAMAPRLVVRP